ncbi:MAG: hypothetical protein K6T83_13860 [Alicyclobacillus sp.]|nr:hypothetical protein [Alicyclobacillus sp.]
MYKRSFSGEAKAAAFLLGGIGTGNVSLGARGELRDWEIWNVPAKGQRLPNTFFCIWARREGGEPVCKVLESRLTPPHNLSHGYHPSTAAGLPRLKGSVLQGRYPVAELRFEDDDLPVQVELEAFTPLIPLNPEDSGIPGAYLTYRVTNLSNRQVETTIVGSIMNPVGGLMYDRFGNLHPEMPCGQNVNELREEGGVTGLFLHSLKHAAGDLAYGDMTLATTNQRVTYKRAWLRGAWYDDLQEFWDDFSADGRLSDLGYDTPSSEHRTDTGSLGVCETLAPWETKVISFILSWYFPNRINGWNDHVRAKEPGREIVRNHYAIRFRSSWEVARYLAAERMRLCTQTFCFRDALFGSTLPESVIDALAGTMPVLRSTTCFWLEDGRFLGYEGCFDDLGSCEGTCTHVWNYAQTLAFLFPTLEQSMRRIEFLEEVDEAGKMNFRAMRMFGCVWMWNGKEAPAAADGQLGTVMRVYREWKLSGNEGFLKELWPNIKKCIAYAFAQWDSDGDLVLDGEQHVTYDIEFLGPNPLTGVLLLGALKAAAAMARRLGDDQAAREYEDAYATSSRRLDELCWGGEYYTQRLEEIDRYKYQYGTGCLSDQLLGQQFAHLYGLGYLLPQDRVRKAMESVYEYNFKTDMTRHVNCQRTYVLNDESGLVLCTWPQGGRPKLPFVYSDEVWTGVEYQVATHLIYEGLVDEGLRVVEGVRERHDGYRRNPWNEVECGHHYARSMASWGLLIALSGFTFDMGKGEMGFNPVINRDDFFCFWSTGRGWGTYRQVRNPVSGEYECSVDVLYGDMTGVRVHACGKTSVL